jgi:hypothetical protein
MMIEDIMSLEDQFLHCRSLYNSQKDKTAKAARDAKAELERLIQSVDMSEGQVAQLRKAKSGDRLNLNLPEDDAKCADLKKLLFVNTQISLAHSIMQTLLARDATWQCADFLEVPDEQQMAARVEIYQQAIRLLFAMEMAFREAACIESKFFAPIWEASVNIIKNYSKTCLGGTAAGGLLGALGGAGVVHFHIGWQALLASLCGEASALSGAIVGGVAGVLICGAIVALIALYEHAKGKKNTDAAADLCDMKDKISKIADKGLNVDELIQLEDLFSKAFKDPVRLALDESCPICLMHFRADGGSESERAIKAPNCQGNHMVHRRCLRDWQFQSGDDTCIICRQ